METARIWVIDHKASLNDNSPMNMDGSAWLLAVCVLSAADETSAKDKFKEFLAGEAMELIETYEFKEYLQDNYSDDSRRSRQISRAAEMVKADGETCYVYVRTSAALEINKGAAADDG